MMILLGLLQHLSLLIRKAVGKIWRRKIQLPDRAVIKIVNGNVRFEHKFEPFLDEDDFRAMITNSYDIILCDFLKKHLASGDIFIDAGANVGYISAVAASYVGISGEIHSFEPLKECFSRLQVLRDLNPGFHFVLNNVALGEEEGLLPISYNPQRDSRNATLVPGKDYAETYEVPVKRLDKYIVNKIHTPERIKVIKIDVEGFEFPVLKGLEQFFAETAFRPLIVCEIKPWETKNIGYTLEEFNQYMKGFSYRPYNMLQHNKLVDLCKLKDLEVVLFRT